MSQLSESAHDAWGDGPSIRFTVPATSANLGTAFDCAAVALRLHLEVIASPRHDPGVDLTYRGSQPELVGTGSDNLLVQALEEGTRRFGGSEPHLWIHVRSDIPIGVGLGSSAAAIVAGLGVAASLAPTRPSDEVLLALAAELDGHPDNVAAAYLGGFVVAARTGTDDRLLTARTDVPADVSFTLAIPDQTMATHAARATLPTSYSREDAVHNLQRTALLVAAAFSGRFDFRPDLFDDRWHQGQRAQLIAGAAECLALRDPRLLGVCLSGSGSAVLAISRGHAGLAEELLRGAFASAGVDTRTLSLLADNDGVFRRFLDG
ncbi:MAG: homoserine kinase [Candidatus Dormibacteria bacterium]